MLLMIKIFKSYYILNLKSINVPNFIIHLVLLEDKISITITSFSKLLLLFVILF